LVPLWISKRMKNAASGHAAEGCCSFREKKAATSRRTRKDGVMASRWFYKLFDQEVGPVGFQDLAEMVAKGTLTEDDRVRREFSEEWIAARDVIGLFRAAQVAPPAASTEAEPRAAAPPAKPLAWTVRKPGLRSLLVVGAMVVMVLAVVLYEAWSHRRPARFPKSAVKVAQPGDPEWLAAVLAPRPTAPSVPGLEARVPKPVPGLEAIDPAYSPWLTPDLKTIVYAAMPDFETAYDLYIADREDLSRPFGTPRLIGSCRSRMTEAYPTMSPDGLELIFVRGDSNPQFFHARRATASGEFGEPVRWEPSGHGVAKPYLLRAQFVDNLRLTFATVDLANQARGVFMVERKDPRSSFQLARRIPMANAWPLYFFSAGGRRAFCHSEDGLFLSLEDSKSGSFGAPVRFIDTAVTGPIDGPIWVAPNEDVIFYCSPGPGKKPGLGPGDKGRKLWMIRF